MSNGSFLYVEFTCWFFFIICWALHKCADVYGYACEYNIKNIYYEGLPLLGPHV